MTPDSVAATPQEPVAWRVRFEGYDDWLLYYSDPRLLPDEGVPEIVQPLYAQSFDRTTDPRVSLLAEKIRTASIEQIGGERFAVLSMIIPAADIDDFADAICAVTRPDGGG